ncbi:MAG: aminotransferase class I/II-fold pyridoxal phosphate-dependent enzyme, partial [bacterium]
LCPDNDTYRLMLNASDMPSTAGGIAPIIQVAAAAAFRDAWPWVAAFVDHLRGQRDYAVERLARMDGMRCNRPEGTYVLFPRISPLGLSSGDLVDTLLHDARVAVVPGTPAFFGPGGAGHIRICYATSRTILSEGLDRIENWIQQSKEHV